MSSVRRFHWPCTGELLDRNQAEELFHESCHDDEMNGPPLPRLKRISQSSFLVDGCSFSLRAYFQASGCRRKSPVLPRRQEKYIYTYIHIYIYIYIAYMLWSYYLGHVWGFLIVTDWATFVLLKRLFDKNAIKIGVSADFLFKAKRGPNIFNSY